MGEREGEGGWIGRRGVSGVARRKGWMGRFVGNRCLEGGRSREERGGVSRHTWGPGRRNPPGTDNHLFIIVGNTPAHSIPDKRGGVRGAEDGVGWDWWGQGSCPHVRPSASSSIARFIEVAQCPPIHHDLRHVPALPSLPINRTIDRPRPGFITEPRPLLFVIITRGHLSRCALLASPVPSTSLLQARPNSSPIHCWHDLQITMIDCLLHFSVHSTFP
ncbi:hypothetical protein E2C01_088736 [Portunus trituberculatus]|uniref:Uncharacterized protein n=1 Tax=Portunus trituberculatus TaxID=210409 RepID=A0A5B7JBJ6_PORTR|nr:hypothetical protein [Portunus trituberculatus]